MDESIDLGQGNIHDNYLLQNKNKTGQSKSYEPESLKFNPIDVQETLKESKTSNIRKPTSRKSLKIQTVLDSDDITLNRGNSNNETNIDVVVNKKFVNGDSNVKLNSVKKPHVQSKAGLSVKEEVLKEKTPIKAISDNLSKVKNLKKTPDQSIIHHLNKNISPIQVEKMLRKSRSPEEAQFDKTLKVRIKKLSTSPIVKETSNNCKLSLSDPSNKKEAVLSSHSSIDGTKTNTSIINMEPDTPIKNLYVKQNFTEQNMKCIQSVTNESNNIINNPTIEHHNKSANSKARTRKASIDVLPNIKNCNETPLNKNMHNIKNTVISRNSQKKLILQRMSQIRKRISQIIDEKEIKINSNDTNLIADKNFKRNSNDSSKIETKKLANLQSNNLIKFKVDNSNKNLKFNDSYRENPNKIEIRSVSILKPSNVIRNDPLPSFDVFKKPMVKLEPFNKIKNGSSLLSNASEMQIADRKNLAEFFTKDEKTSSKTSTKDLNITDLNSINLDLSDSIVEFVENDLTQNKIDIAQFDRILQPDNLKTEEALSKLSISKSSNTSIVEELLKQVAEEKVPNEQPETKTENKNMVEIKKTLENEQKLLHNLGLDFIKNSNSEAIPIDQEHEMQSKAKKFADVLKRNTQIWNTRGSRCLIEDREQSFNTMKKDLDCAFKLNFKLLDIKRIVNLIMSWYTNLNNLQLIHKKTIPKTLRTFYDFFMFLPKTGRPIYTCEFCNVQSRTESSYLLHRCTHTGGAPYNCSYCGKAFLRPTAFKTHESKHVELKDMPLRQVDPTATSGSPKTNVLSEVKLKRPRSPEEHTANNIAKRYQVAGKLECNICHNQFKTVEELYAHRITHAKYKSEGKLCKGAVPSDANLQKRVETIHKHMKLRHKSPNKH